MVTNDQQEVTWLVHQSLAQSQLIANSCSLVSIENWDTVDDEFGRKRLVRKDEGGQWKKEQARKLKEFSRN